MGSALSTVQQGGKIDISLLNETSTRNLTSFIKLLSDNYPKIARVPFKQGLKWNSTSSFSSFGTLTSPDYTADDESIVSSIPSLKITKADNGQAEIEVCTIKGLVDIINCTGESEVIPCLTGNSDPIVMILGAAFGTPSVASLIEGRNRLNNATDDNDDVDMRFKLSLLVNDISIELINSVAENDGKTVQLTPGAIEQEVLVIRSQCIGTEVSCLKGIKYTSEVVLDNGCRSPPWCQLNGDICYISADPWDCDPVCITASVEGYYETKGFTADNIPSERVGDVYTTLADLLKNKSQKFTECYKNEGGAGLGMSNGESPSLEDLISIQTNKKASIMVNSLKTELSRPVTRGKNTKNLMTPHGDSKRKSASSFKSSHHDMSVVGEAESESSESGSEEEDLGDRRPESTADLPSEYWQIQKLIKYLKGGNQTATIISLCLLLDFDLTQEASHLAIRDNGGLDTLINLLETEDIKCKIGTLRILKTISTNTQTRTAIVDLKGLPQLVSILESDSRELKCLAAETIANIAKFRRGRRIVRHQGGLQYLVNMLESPGRPGSPISGERSDIEVSRCAAQGLWSCSRSKKNKMKLLKTKVVPLLGKLLQSNDEGVLIPVVGTLQECASEPMYQAIIRSEGMVEHLVKGLHLDSTELKMHCAAAIFKCAEDDSTRELVYKFNGLESLAKLLSATDNKELLTAATGAIWKCSRSPAIVQQLKQLKAVEKLVALITNQPEEVQINVVGAIGDCAAQDSENRVIIRKAGGVTPLVQLLTGTNQPLLINTTKAVGACALDNESMTIIDKQDGVRLLWSLLKSYNPEVQACAAWAICPCIQNAKDAGELVRSFVGGLELIVGLLKSEDVEVLASVCAAIAKIAQDEENLAVITDHGVVSMLSRLTNTSNDKLRHHLADAIARCCSWRNNRVGFGQNSAVAPLVGYLNSVDRFVHQTTACALHQLSKDPNNCITMHEAGVVQLLLPMVGSKDEILQEAAAGCISNIRHLALANEKAKHK